MQHNLSSCARQLLSMKCSGSIIIKTLEKVIVVRVLTVIKTCYWYVYKSEVAALTRYVSHVLENSDKWPILLLVSSSHSPGVTQIFWPQTAFMSVSVSSVAPLMCTSWVHNLQQFCRFSVFASKYAWKMRRKNKSFKMKGSWKEEIKKILWKLLFLNPLAFCCFSWQFNFPCKKYSLLFHCRY